MQRNLEEKKGEYKRAEQQRAKELAAAQSDRYKLSKPATMEALCLLMSTANCIAC